MNQKKLYIWRLAKFLRSEGMVMSAEELAEHLNRNNFLTEYGEEYRGGRGTYRLIKITWAWVHDELQLPSEAEAIALAFVNRSGQFAYSDTAE